MSLFFMDEILEQVSNKFLAVNIAAKRAFFLNETGFPMLMSDNRKPASIALEELRDGKIDYEELDDQ
jgi:DNA-directed RNA polymerase omega subunit